MGQGRTPGRRAVLLGAGALAAAGVAGCQQEDRAGRTPGAPSAERTGTSAAPGGRALPISPLLTGTTQNGVTTFDLRAQAGLSRLLPDKDTRTWGFNGAHLGPTLRARSGQTVRVRVHNALDEATTVHWHGMHLPAEYDGGPHQLIQPGSTWQPSWKINQQAATLWYHPHPHGSTSAHAYRGLAGLFLVDDDNPRTAVLPHDYGVDDLPLVLQDRRFHSDGSLDETDRPDVGLLGDTVLVNGVVHPQLRAQRRRLRLRILAGAPMRLFNLAFSDGRTFWQVASDGGVLDAPKARTTLPLSPGERAEIVVDLQPQEQVTLRAVKFDDNLGVSRRGAPNFGLQDEFDLLSITGPDSGAQPAPLPTAGLNPADRTPAGLSTTPVRTMDLQWFQINGREMDMNRIDEIVDHHGDEVWQIQNHDNWIHNFHVHDTQFRVLSIEGGSSHRLTEGWKDTVLLAPGAVARVALRFADYESTRWPYMYHCHLMFHEDQGMMGQFMVTAPGQAPEPPFSTTTRGAKPGRSSGPSSSSADRDDDRFGDSDDSGDTGRDRGDDGPAGPATP